MNPKTEKVIQDMLAHARHGSDIIPMFFQPIRGRSNTVSAAIRTAKARGLIEANGKDGSGNIKYRAVMPTSTHSSTKTVN